jgi:hypothetical protein
MIVYDLNSGHREYPGYDEIEDRRGGGRGRSRRSDGTYMGYGGGIYDHYGMHEKMNEMEKIGLGSSSDSSYEGPIWSWFVNKVELWQKNNVWDSFSAEFLWGLYCRIKKV